MDPRYFVFILVVTNIKLSLTAPPRIISRAISSELGKDFKTISCSTCPPGYGVSRACSTTEDTVCKHCPKGYHSSKDSPEETCQPCSRCGEDLFEIHPCQPTTDVFCGLCGKPGEALNEDYAIKCGQEGTVGKSVPKRLKTSKKASNALDVMFGDEPQAEQVPEIAADNSEEDKDPSKIVIIVENENDISTPSPASESEHPSHEENAESDKVADGNELGTTAISELLVPKPTGVSEKAVNGNKEEIDPSKFVIIVENENEVSTPKAGTVSSETGEDISKDEVHPSISAEENFDNEVFTHNPEVSEDPSHQEKDPSLKEDPSHKDHVKSGEVVDESESGTAIPESLEDADNSGEGHGPSHHSSEDISDEDGSGEVQQQVVNATNPLETKVESNDKQTGPTEPSAPPTPKHTMMKTSKNSEGKNKSVVIVQPDVSGFSHPEEDKKDSGASPEVFYKNGDPGVEASTKGGGVGAFPIIIVVLTCGIIFFMLGFYFNRYNGKKLQMYTPSRHQNSYQLAPTGPKEGDEDDYVPKKPPKIIYTSDDVIEKKTVAPLTAQKPVEKEKEKEKEKPKPPIAGKSGKHQSPIDISPSDAVFDDDLSKTPLIINYVPENTKSLINTGSTVKITIDCRGSDLHGGPLGNTRFCLDHFHFHWGTQDSEGSEHTVNGKGYAAELHLVHWNKELFKSFNEASKYENGLCVIGVFLEASNEGHQDMQALLDVFNSIRYKGESCEVPHHFFDPASLLPEKSKEYWTYPGSLTVPPYNESVHWIVMKNTIKVSHKQMEIFRDLRKYNKEGGALSPTDDEERYIRDNYRCTMKLGDRILRASFR